MSGDGGVMNIVCYYCGHTSHSMMEAVRHDSDRPESCLAWPQQNNRQQIPEEAEIDSILRALTVKGEANLDQALDEYYERIEHVYR
jgi:hypothetical protein